MRPHCQLERNATQKVISFVDLKKVNDLLHLELMDLNERFATVREAGTENTANDGGGVGFCRGGGGEDVGARCLVHKLWLSQQLFSFAK